MATAVETSSSQPRTPSSTAGLVFASLVGAVYVAAAVGVVFYALPHVWRQSVSPELVGYSFLDAGLRVCAQVAAALGLWKVGQAVAGANPPKGLRGGIFLMIAAGFIVFFVARRVGLLTEEYGFGLVLTGAVAVGLAVFAFRLFSSPRGERWMVALEEQGWFHTHAYKRALGQKVRRLTILGLLLVGATGVYSLVYQGLIPNDWFLRMPFDWPTLNAIPDARYVVPLLLIGLALWVAYRLVNMPAFGEFLIATEAEMNKVSWTSRRRLAQDTVVVLVTTFLMVMFLFLVDWFWGWLLSRQMVGVLPSPAATKSQQEQNEQVKW